MSHYTLNLELPRKPDGNTLQKVLTLLGVITQTDDAAAGDDLAGEGISVAEENTSDAAVASTAAPMLIGRDEAAAKLGISTSTLDRWRKNGNLPVVKLPGAAPMFSVRDLKKFVGRNSKLSSPKQRK